MATKRCSCAQAAGTAVQEVTFGSELVLDLYDCDPETMRSGEKIRAYARELCRVIDMKPYGEPQTPYFGENNEYTKGYSLLQFIETSSIVGHFSEAKGSVYLNIFSCKEFDHKKAEQFTWKYFRAKRVVARSLIRK
ncbi:MAG: S-adenosylmethionine decarboxylase [Planctomycetota bacterium]